jgi:hypothetical protein
MLPQIILIQKPAIDFATFLGASHRVLGYSPAASLDESRLPRSDSERFLSCLAALKDAKAAPGLTPNLLQHVSFSAFLVCDDRDLIDILEATAGMSFVTADTVSRGAVATVVTGTLGQWRDAVKSGLKQDAQYNIRHCFNRVMALFEECGLAGVWKDFQAKPLSDNTFYLEDKR